MPVDIVLAEDEDGIGFIVKTQLQSSGISVHWERDGQRALDAIVEHQPKAVVLDLMMPVMSGFEVLAKLKEDAGLRGLPVLVLSARNQKEDVQRAIDLGAKDFMIKPFLPSELVGRVRRMIQGK